MHHIYHSLFSAIAAHDAANTALRTAPPLPALWRSAARRADRLALPTGRAMALQPHAAAVLRISQGAAWVTLPSQPGDHFLQAGDTLHIRAGDRVVMEPWQHGPAAHTPANRDAVL